MSYALIPEHAIAAMPRLSGSAVKATLNETGFIALRQERERLIAAERYAHARSPGAIEER